MDVRRTADVAAGLLLNRGRVLRRGPGSTPGTKVKQKILTFDWDQQIQPRLGFSFVPDHPAG